MLYKFLVTILILDSIVLIAAVLLQSGKGGGLAASFGGASSSADQIFGTRQAGNLLTQISWWGGGIFIGLAFILQIMTGAQRTPTSVLDKSFAAPTTAPATQSAPPASTVPLQNVPATPAPAAAAPATPAPATGAPAKKP